MLLGAAVRGGGIHSQSTQSNKASQFNANLQVVSVKEHVSAAGGAWDSLAPNSQFPKVGLCEAA